MGLLPLTLVSKHQSSQSRDEHLLVTAIARSQPYLTGVRGILVIQSFLWTYFYTFIPTLVAPQVDEVATDGPIYQKILGDILSVIFWDTSLISSFFIILSMRTIGVNFLQKPSSPHFAGILIRRIIRMTILLSAASSIATLIISQTGTSYIEAFRTDLPNETAATPEIAKSVLTGFNSIFDLFSLTTGLYTQAANTFWPSGTLWVSSLIYYEGWTVYILMVMLPYTRAEWHPQGLLLFALGSFWYGSWGWYAACGLLLADISTNAILNSHFKRGFAIRGETRCPSWIIAALMVIIGLVLKYIFRVLPRYRDSMLVLHPFLDLSEQTNRSQYAAEGPYPRLDDGLVVLGILTLVESFPDTQRILSARSLVWLGERAFGYFAAQSIIFWTGGIRLWVLLHTPKYGLNSAAANSVILVVCLPAIALFAELFYRVVDLPSRWTATKGYLWLLE